MQHGSFKEEDDGLGYYDDGVKRTLTDEQIAMFRHSEIYSIIRQRVVRKENEEAEGKQHSVTAASDNEAEAERSAPLALELEKENESDDEEEYAEFLGAEQEQVRIEALRSNRKRVRVDGGGSQDRAPTHRRLVRELDSVAADDGVLDYGEEPYIPKNNGRGSEGQKDSHTFDGRKQIVYDEASTDPLADSDVPLQPAQATPTNGRKIWWPTIGK